MRAGVQVSLASLPKVHSTVLGLAPKKAEARKKTAGLNCVPLLRRGSDELDCGPNFIIIGAQKAATTSLFGLTEPLPRPVRVRVRVNRTLTSSC
jgi:hypothetical protein